jgi:hypothetical protein
MTIFLRPPPQRLTRLRNLRNFMIHKRFELRGSPFSPPIIACCGSEACDGRLHAQSLSLSTEDTHDCLPDLHAQVAPTLAVDIVRLNPIFFPLHRSLPRSSTRRSAPNQLSAISVPMADANQEKKVKLERESRLIPIEIYKFPSQNCISCAEHGPAQIKSVDMVRSNYPCDFLGRLD